jgi:hypothetical protein
MTDATGTGDATSPATTPTPPATGDTTASGATPSTTDDKSGDDLRDAGVRALTAEREARQAAERRAAESDRRVAELEDAGKSEVERALNQAKRDREAREAAEARLNEFERSAAKQRIAVEVGLPLELAERLHGDDDRALRADAKRLLDLTQPPDGRLGAGRGGGTPTRVADDMNARIREATGRG